MSVLASSAPAVTMLIKEAGDKAAFNNVYLRPIAGAPAPDGSYPQAGDAYFHQNCHFDGGNLLLADGHVKYYQDTALAGFGTRFVAGNLGSNDIGFLANHP